MKILIVLGLAVQLIACSSTKIFLDPEKIISYSYSANRQEPYPAPYVAYFEKGSKKLAYLGVNHTTDPQSDTFRSIEKVFQEFKPDALVIEGVEYDGVDSPNFFSEYAKKCEKRNWSGCTEAAFAARQADLAKIPFIPSEPKDEMLTHALPQVGYPKKDYFLFMAGQMITHFKRQDPEKLKDLSTHLHRSNGVTLQEFKNWYRRIMKKPFKIEELDQENFAPQIDHNPTPLNRISTAVSEIREKEILKRIQMAVDRFNRVFVIFGSGHLVRERKVLESAFGDSKNVKHFDGDKL